MKTVDTDECWLWPFNTNNKGYAQWTTLIEGKRPLAHRLMYESFVGSIEPSQQVDHLCRVTSCINPDHLEAVSARENIMRSNGVASLNSKKTHCPNGHPYDGQNTRHRRDRPNRFCRICTRENVYRSRERIKRA